MNRSERVLCLVWSLPDALPAPGSWSGSLTRGQPRRATAGDPMVEGAAGPAPAGGLFRPVEGCEWCQEPPRSRWDDVRRTWVPVPERYDRLPRGSGARAGRRCVACGGSGWRPALRDANGSGGVRPERIAYRLAGPYRELERAFELMGRPHRRLVIRQADAYPRRVDGADELVSWLSRQLPHRITLAAGVVEAWHAREERRWQLAGPGRDQRIRRLVAEGESVTRIAARAHVSERHVRRIAYGPSAGAC